MGGVSRRVAVLAGLLLGLCPGSAMALPRAHASTAHTPGVVTVPLGQNASAALFDPTPARDAPGGRLFVAVQGPFDYMDNPRGAGLVRVLDARSGRLLGTIPAGYAPDSLALDASTHRLFVANRIDHTVTVVDSRTGTSLRTVLVPPAPLWLAADAGTEHVALVGGGVSDSAGTPLGNGGVSLLDAESGRVLRTTPIAGIAQAWSIDHRRGRAYVLADAVAAVDLKSGGLAGSIAFQGRGMSIAADEQTDRVFVLTSRRPSPAAPDAFYLSTFLARSGRLLGSTALQGNVMSLTAVAARHLLVFAYGDAQSTLVSVVDALTGRVLHVTDSNGMMGLLGNAAPVVDVRRSRAFVGLASAASAGVGVWDMRTGMLSRTIAVTGSYVQAMACDERSGRLYAISVAQEPNPQSYLTIIDPRP